MSEAVAAERRRRWGRVAAIDATLLLAVVAAWQLVEVGRARPALLASDVVRGYLPGAQRFLDTGSPYTAEQLAGPWTVDFHSFIHPPAALPLFVAFLVLPLVLWWVLPIGLTALAVVRLRPAVWAWPVMALLVCWPRSTGSLLAGNSDMWAMAGIAAGAVWGWPVAAIAIKPTFAPLAVVAIRRRSAWVAAAVLGVAILVTLPMWLDWLTVVRNAGLSPWYSLLNVPLVAVPVVAWLARARDARGPTGGPSEAPGA